MFFGRCLLMSDSRYETGCFFRGLLLRKGSLAPTNLSWLPVITVNCTKLSPFLDVFFQEHYPFSHNHGSVKKFTLNERKLILEIHPFSTSMIMGGRVHAISSFVCVSFPAANFWSMPNLLVGRYCRIKNNKEVDGQTLPSITQWPPSACLLFMGGSREEIAA